MKVFQLLQFGALISAIQGFAGRFNGNIHLHTWPAASFHAHSAVNGERRNDLIPLATMSKLIFLVPSDSTVVSKFGTNSPIGCPLLHDAVRHVALKTNYFTNGTLDWEVVSVYPSNDISHNDNKRREELSTKLLQADILVTIGLRSPDELLFAREVFSSRRKSNRLQAKGGKYLCHFALDCAQPIPALVGPYDPIRPSKRSRFLPWTLGSSGRRLHKKMLGLFERWTSDDFCYALVLFLNQFSGRPVDWVKHRIDASWEKGAFRNSREFYAMMKECSDCAIPCLKDEKCRECLGKLARLDPRDQAASYRTLVSYESELLARFSLCIFTKKNIFQCDAHIPTMPHVQPIQTWRGHAVTEDDGRALFVGHLNDSAAPSGSRRLPVSWKVACGANVAYDQFPCQNQVFYPSSRGRDMWYDPVFRVETLDGRHVWCKRHYRVRAGPRAATFRLSVLDNGVTTDEFWTIVGAADDLSWIVFHYAGAAKVIGLHYLGGLLCTPDGSLPDERQLPSVWDCLRRAGIQPWELNVVDNQLDSPGAIAAGPPPLDFYRNTSRSTQSVHA
jgi:VDE lipocalin domain